VTATFLTIGGFGLLLLAASLFRGGGHLHIGHVHLHLPAGFHGHGAPGHVGSAGLPQGNVAPSGVPGTGVTAGSTTAGDAGGHGGTALSLPSIAGFIGAFGFAGAIAAQVGHPRAAWIPCLIGLVAAVPTGWFGARVMRAAMEMPTDATPTRADVIGALGVVIRAIPGDGYGEVRVRFAGQQVKFHARAATPLPAGASILVIEAPSTTSVVVEPATRLLG